MSNEETTETIDDHNGFSVLENKMRHRAEIFNNNGDGKMRIDRQVSEMPRLL